MASPHDARQSPWWTEDDPLQTLVSTADDLRDRDVTRRTAIRIWDDLYEGRALFSPDNARAIQHIGLSGIEAPLLNFARRAVDFVHSRCASETPSVRAAGHGAGWDQHNRARDLSKFIEGAMDDLEVPTELPRSLLSGLRTGTGCTKVVVADGRIALEVTSPRELFVDADDARHGRPRCLYQIKAVDRRSVMDQFPDCADDLLSTPATSDTFTVTDTWNQTQSETDAVDLYEGWCLPRGREGHAGHQPGRHVVCVQNRVLLDEEWTVPRFPVAFLRASDPSEGSGFWGQGLLERLDGAQFEIDELIRHIGESIRHSNLKVFVDDQADIPTDLVADPTVGTIIPYKGSPPIFHVPPTVARETIEHLRQLIDWLYAVAGMSEQASSGGVPAAIGSGRAQLFYHQFQSQNYVDLIRRYGQHVVDVIERVLDAAKSLSEEEPGWRVRYARGSVIREIDWSEVDMDRDDYVIELEEVSPVPDSFAGRLQQIEQDAAEGRIPPEYLARLREDPDGWWMARRTARADVDFVEHVIDQLLNPSAPMPRIIDEMNKPMMMDALRTEVLNAVVAGRDPEVVARLQAYLHEVVASMPKEPPQPQQPAPPQGGPPVPPQQ